jgi:acetyl esterase/lipase
VYTSNASGTWEVRTWDRDSGEHRQVTDRPNGTTEAVIDPAGEYIWWFSDSDGDEFGVWRRQRFTSDHSSSEEALPGLEPSYPAGLELGRTVVVAGRATDEGCTIHALAVPATTAGAPGTGPASSTRTVLEETRLLYSHSHDASVTGLSRDDELVVIAHSEHGDSAHPALRVLRVRDGSIVADLADGPGRGLHAAGFSPISGDTRLLVVHERRGRPELLLWDPVAGITEELPLLIEGELSGQWFPDGSALLIESEHQARSTLHRLELGDHSLSLVETPTGVVDEAVTRPDGTVEFHWSNAASPPQNRFARSRAPGNRSTETQAAENPAAVLFALPGESAPASRPVQDAWVDGPAGPIHVLWSIPAGSPGTPRSLATVFFLHGGPHWLDSDRFMPSRAAWLDAGYAVVQVNYRGSTGYGSAWRDAIIGRPGLTELEDVAAAYDWATGGFADPRRCILAGRSWGGYLTLLGLGTQPGRWAAGIAGVPVADYLAAYADEMEPLRAFDRVLFNGSPAEVTDTYAASSPLTYADQVNAPVLVTAGRNDPRCPIRQIDNYVRHLHELGKPVEEYRYNAGHGSVVVEEAIRIMSAELDFARRQVPAGP